jgi:hypothetical protein
MMQIAYSKKSVVGLIGRLIMLILTVGKLWGQTNWLQFVFSQDGVPISYEISGFGEPTLVFVHCWSCDARYWRNQAGYFSQKYRVVTLDLAGHGQSGLGRSQYTLSSFGEDVRALVEATGIPWADR